MAMRRACAAASGDHVIQHAQVRLRLTTSARLQDVQAQWRERQYNLT